jgi:hypothetical protein
VTVLRMQWQQLQGVIFHDSFSESFVREYETEKIRFVNVQQPRFSKVGGVCGCPACACNCVSVPSFCV